MSEETRISSDEEKTALDDNELFLKLKQDMADVLALVRKIHQTRGSLGMVIMTRQASEKIETVRSELYLLQEAIDDLGEKALTVATYGTPEQS